MTWRDHAACKGATHLFYATERDDRAGDLRQHARVVVYKEAEVICMACPVRAECLEDALNTGEVSYGMWGGMSPTARRHLRQSGGLQLATTEEMTYQ